VKIAAVTIGKDYQTWTLTNIRHLSFVEGYRDEWTEVEKPKSLERVSYLAERRNNAVREVSTLFPDITHVFMLDSYYLNQKQPAEALLNHYDLVGHDTILGGSTWFHERFWPHREAFWDSWTTPEGLDPGNHTRFLEVKAVGGAVIFPVSAWKRHGFDTSRFPQGSEMNGFCENSGLKVHLDLMARFYHPDPPQASYVRIRLGNYRRKILGR